MGFIGPETFCSDLVFLIPNATLYHFGVLQSQTHNAWMRAVVGRLKSDCRYSAGVVYNNFVWPEPTSEQRKHIESCAQAVLDAAVETAYGVNFNSNEEKIVAHLFKLYAEKSTSNDNDAPMARTTKPYSTTCPTRTPDATTRRAHNQPQDEHRHVHRLQGKDHRREFLEKVRTASAPSLDAAQHS